MHKHIPQICRLVTIEFFPMMWKKIRRPSSFVRLTDVRRLAADIKARHRGAGRTVSGPRALANGPIGKTSLARDRRRNLDRRRVLSFSVSPPAYPIEDVPWPPSEKKAGTILTETNLIQTYKGMGNRQVRPLFVTACLVLNSRSLYIWSAVNWSHGR